MFAECSLAVLVTARWKHRCSLEEQRRNKCFSHAVNNIVRKDVAKVVLWVLPGGMFSFFLSFFFLLPSSPCPPTPPFIQSNTEHLQGKEKIKLLKLNKSIPVEKGWEGRIWPGQALGSDLGTERENLLEEVGCHSCWHGGGRGEEEPRAESAAWRRRVGMRF